MQFFTKQQFGALAMAYLLSFVVCQDDGPQTTDDKGVKLPRDAHDDVLNTLQHDGDGKLLPRQKDVPLLTWWLQENFQPELQEITQSEPSSRRGLGDCQYMGRAVQDSAMSAKAPPGWKCTFYDDEGCHGYRTKEFDQNGIAKIEGKMFKKASSWRCCQIGRTNYWGYCDGKLAEGRS